MSFIIMLILLAAANAVLFLLYYFINRREKLDKRCFPAAASVAVLSIVLIAIVFTTLPSLFKWQKIILSVLIPFPCFAVLHVLGHYKLREAYKRIDQLEAENERLKNRAEY